MTQIDTAPIDGRRKGADDAEPRTQAEFILKKLREQNVTQEVLAERLRCRQNVIAGWKRRGFIPVRQQPRLLKIAQELGAELTPDDFFAVAA